MSKLKVNSILQTALFLTLAILNSSCSLWGNTELSTFPPPWSLNTRQTWAGSHFWANRLQDWHIINGRLECIKASPDNPMRTVHLLTARLNDRQSRFTMTVQTGLINKQNNISPNTATGFLIGAGRDLDYRAASLIHHSAGANGGLFAGINGQGELFISDFSITPAKKGIKGYYGKILAAQSAFKELPDSVSLELTATPEKIGYRLALKAVNTDTKQELTTVHLENIKSDRLIGNVALVSHPGTGRNTGRFWFKDWNVTGKKFTFRPDRQCGPVISAQYTLSENTLKLTAQLMPIDLQNSKEVTLQIKTSNTWKTIAIQPVNSDSFTATFSIDNWDATKNIDYKITTDLSETNNPWYGTICKEPLDKKSIVVAAFTGNHNVARPGVDRGQFNWTQQALWFPHTDVVQSITHHKPDVLFFSGDQVYEGASPTRPDRSSPENMKLDYLYKWYLWCWAFGDLCRNTPAVIIPDDHDVYQGNLWGAGGRPTKNQGDGGYVYPPDFVNMVERTQTSHLPAPNDPTPVEQGIGVYYCSMKYGGIDFAILEDRKFKSSARTLIPGSITVGETEFNKPGFDPATDGDVPGAILLGQRQLDFLRQWSLDWNDDIWAKAVLSQTLFSHVQTYPVGKGSKGTQSLPPDAYPVDELRTNTDSNGWPQTGRNNALRLMRRCFAVHLAGDTHLGNTIQYGVDKWEDASYALCVPSIANFYPRRWYPPNTHENKQSVTEKYTGNFLDSFGNKMTVHAVSNPVLTGHRPAELHDKAPGYGIAHFNKQNRQITFECWPRWQNPSSPNAKPYTGWPVSFNLLDNYTANAKLKLPTLKIAGVTDPVIQIIDESNDETLYTLRINGNTFQPKVFTLGSYTIKIGQSNPYTLTSLNASNQTDQIIRIDLTERKEQP